MVSLLYDVAGRSEDAFKLTWELVDFDKRGGGRAHLKPGKTGFKRETIFSPLTQNLLLEHRGPSPKQGPLFP